MRNRVFHQVSIAGMTFEGVISGDGPYLSCQKGSGEALGPAGLRHFLPGALGTRRVPPLGWWVLKYDHEERIFPAGLRPRRSAHPLQ